jgi:hypothetical protein
MGHAVIVYIIRVSRFVVKLKRIKIKVTYGLPKQWNLKDETKYKPLAKVLHEVVALRHKQGHFRLRYR